MVTEVGWFIFGCGVWVVFMVVVMRIFTMVSDANLGSTYKWLLDC